LFFGENPQVVTYSAQPSYDIKAKSVYIYICYQFLHRQRYIYIYISLPVKKLIYIYDALADTMSLKQKRNLYDAQFKLKVIKFAEENNSAADRHFAVSEKLVRDWRKQKKYLFERTKRAKRYGVSQYLKLETALNDWVLEYRHNGYIVTRMMIRIQAIKFTRDKQYEVGTGFKASLGWCSQFMNWCGLTLRQRTHIAQKLPKDVEDKIISFHQYIIKQRKEMAFEFGQIGNMDETLMTFDMAGFRTVNKKGDKTVRVKTTGSEKAHFTVILSCLADGTKLPAMVIFKRKTMPKDKLPSGVNVAVQEKRWVDKNLLQQWLKNVWDRRPGALLKKKSMLVWDMFKAYLVDSMKKQLKKKKTTQAVIPGGCTSLLQLLDLCLNKPFKGEMHKLWNNWMTEGDKPLTAAGNLKRPSIPLVIGWFKAVWGFIPEEMVHTSFLNF